MPTLTIEKRNKQIKELRYTKQWRYKAIGEKFGISVERVRQICDEREANKEDLLLKVADAYAKKFQGEKIGAKEILEDIALLSNQDRSKPTVIKRNALITYLHEELGFSFLAIGRLLNRDHSTIMHAYYRNKKK